MTYEVKSTVSLRVFVPQVVGAKRVARVNFVLSALCVFYISYVLTLAAVPAKAQGSLPQQLPQTAEAVLKDGRKLIDMRRYEDAVIRFKQFSSMRPNDPIGYFWSGITLDEMGNYSGSEQAYREAASKADRQGMDSAEIRTNLGNALLKQNKVDEAIDSYKKAIEVNPLYAVAYLNMGRAQIEKGDATGALTSLNRCEELRFKGPHLAYYKAKALIAQGKKDEASVLVKRLLQDLPEGTFKNDVRQEFSAVLNN